MVTPVHIGQRPDLHINVAVAIGNCCHDVHQFSITPPSPATNFPTVKEKVKRKGRVGGSINKVT